MLMFPFPSRQKQYTEMNLFLLGQKWAPGPICKSGMLITIACNLHTTLAC